MVSILDKKSLEPLLNWHELIEWLIEGHRKPLPQINDHLMAFQEKRLFNRVAWIEGLGSAVKTCTIFPNNSKQGIEPVNGMMTLFAEKTGVPEAIIDFLLVTKWKTAADSLLAASLLASPNPQKYLIIGAGTVARSLIEAFTSYYPDLEVFIWNRTESRALDLIREYQNHCNITHFVDLAQAVAMADIVSCATMSREPILKGEWISPETHIDLIGAFSPEMRETDDQTLKIGKIFVDYRLTTLDHIGELIIPIVNGTIQREDIIADFYEMESGRFARPTDDCITVFKNGGGGHLDLMTGRYIYHKWQQSKKTELAIA